MFGAPAAHTHAHTKAHGASHKKTTQTYFWATDNLKSPLQPGKNTNNRDLLFRS